MNGGHLEPNEVSEKRFDTVRKGYDPAAVKEFLERLRGQIEAYKARGDDLEARLVDAERRASNPELDHETLTRVLGHEMAGVLGAAQEAARAVLATAEDEAAKLVDAARAEGARLTGLAESVLEERTKEADVAAQARTAEAQAEARAIIEVGKAEAAARIEAAVAKAAARDQHAKAAAATLVDTARIEGADMVAEARELRTRVLTDLAKRRRVLHLQVERLRAGRESLTEVVRSSRVTFEALDEGLARAEADARLAAEAAVRQVATEAESEVVADLENALVLGRQGDLVGAAATSRRRARPDQAPHAPEPAHESGPQPQAPKPQAPGPQAAKSATEQLAPESQAPEPHAPEPDAKPTAARHAPEPDSKPTAAGQAPKPQAPGPQAAKLAPEPQAQEPQAQEPQAQEPQAQEPLATERLATEQLATEQLATEQLAPESHAPEPAPKAAKPHANPSPAREPARRGALVQPVDALFARLRAAGSRTQGEGAAELNSSHLDADAAPAMPPGSVAAEVALQRRDEALEGVANSLARKLKRALQDDQNAILDQLRVQANRSRGAAGGPTTSLVEADAQLEHFRTVSAPYLIQAASAGADLGAAGSPRAHQAEVTEAAGRKESEELAAVLNGALQRRLDQVLGESEGTDGARTAELIGIAYREWKGERIEGLAGDHVVAAFGRGFLSALPRTALLAWVVDDGGGQCPDCDDNALAGPQGPGEIYPTGQTHPPAHPGCRCLLMRT